VSFYPQVHLNYTRKKTAGLSYDYQAYNFTGFLFYSIYCICTYINYNATNSNNSNNPVAPNDIAFAVHAFLITCVIIGQIVYYHKKNEKFSHSATVSKFAILFLFLAWSFAIYNVCLSILYQIDGDGLPWFGNYSTVSYLGYVKAAISIIKYVPQAYMNWHDQSTTGWSIGNVSLDFTGGTLSLLQQCLSAYNTNDWGFITGNIPKFLLAVESLIFDTLFFIQHFILYGYNKNRETILDDDGMNDNFLTKKINMSH